MNLAPDKIRGNELGLVPVEMLIYDQSWIRVAIATDPIHWSQSKSKTKYDKFTLALYQTKINKNLTTAE
jgi:hypothetical protein